MKSASLMLPLTLCQNAVRHLQSLSKNGTPIFLRVRIKSGGCSGLRCTFSIEEECAETDLCFEKEGACVITDPLSMSFIEGAEIDYSDEMIAAQFVLRNPKAQSACGCGESFSL